MSQSRKVFLQNLGLTALTAAVLTAGFVGDFVATDCALPGVFLMIKGFERAVMIFLL